MSDQEVKTRSGGKAILKEETIDNFRNHLLGRLIDPADPAYAEARKVFNAMHNRHPGFIVQCVGVADVITTVKFAAEQDLLLAVRGGGHSAPGFGTCDGGLVLDLKQMKGIRVNPEPRTIRAEGGCTWGDFNHATYAFGLATTGGIVSTTGIAGLTLGGGMGYLERQCGLSCDNLISADVVLADGSFRVCNENQDKDLFWAIRGGGGNFGVVTSFEYRLHKVGDVLVGLTFFALDGQVLRRYSEFILNAPEQLTAMFALTLAPPLPFLPAEWHQKPVCGVIACWTGELKEGERIIKSFASWGKVIGQLLAPMPYPALNKLFDTTFPPGMQNYWKGNYAYKLSEEAIEMYVKYGAKVPNIESSIFFYPIDGACHRIGSEETAFAYRDINFATFIAGTWRDPSDNERNIQWVRDCYNALRPYTEQAGYVNATSDYDQDEVRANYRQNYKRLVQAKAQYDPTNVFN
jgi:FAD/FMN-containing dehydrogenase